MMNTETKSYEIDGRRILFDGVVCVIRKRKNGLDKKPPYYLYNIADKEYISSLYSVGANTYIFDVKGKDKYLIKFNGSNSYEIEPIGKK